MSEPGAYVNNVDMLDQVDAFFLACWHTVDWLDVDSALPSITRPVILKWFENDLPMAICRAYANTSKHVVLGGRGRLHARPVKFDLLPWGQRMQIEWWSDTELAAKDDAVQLAEACYSRWQHFFRMHDIDFTS